MFHTHKNKRKIFFYEYTLNILRLFNYNVHYFFDFILFRNSFEFFYLFRFCNTEFDMSCCKCEIFAIYLLYIILYIYNIYIFLENKTMLITNVKIII